MVVCRPSNLYEFNLTGKYDSNNFTYVLIKKFGLFSFFLEYKHAVTKKESPDLIKMYGELPESLGRIQNLRTNLSVVVVKFVCVRLNLTELIEVSVQQSRCGPVHHFVQVVSRSAQQ